MKRLGHPLIYPWISKESYSLPKRPVAQQTEQQQVSLKFTSTERSFRIEAEMMQPEESLSIAVATAKFDNLLYLYDIQDGYRKLLQADLFKNQCEFLTYSTD